MTCSECGQEIVFPRHEIASDICDDCMGIKPSPPTKSAKALLEAIVKHLESLNITGPTHDMAVEALTAIDSTAERVEPSVCIGCGNTQTFEEIRASHPTAVSCCPDRKMIPVQELWQSHTKYRGEFRNLANVLKGTPIPREGQIQLADNINAMLEKEL